MANIIFDDVRAEQVVDGNAICKSWVYESGQWSFRELTEEEKEAIKPLLEFDLSWFKAEVTI